MGSAAIKPNLRLQAIVCCAIGGILVGCGSEPRKGEVAGKVLTWLQDAKAPATLEMSLKNKDGVGLHVRLLRHKNEASVTYRWDSKGDWYELVRYPGLSRQTCEHFAEVAERAILSEFSGDGERAPGNKA